MRPIQVERVYPELPSTLCKLVSFNTDEVQTQSWYSCLHCKQVYPVWQARLAADHAQCGVCGVDAILPGAHQSLLASGHEELFGRNVYGYDSRTNDE